MTVVSAQMLCACGCGKPLVTDPNQPYYGHGGRMNGICYLLQRAVMLEALELEAIASGSLEVSSFSQMPMMGNLLTADRE